MVKRDKVTLFGRRCEWVGDVGRHTALVVGDHIWQRIISTPFYVRVRRTSSGVVNQNKIHSKVRRIYKAVFFLSCYAWHFSDIFYQIFTFFTLITFCIKCIKHGTVVTATARYLICINYILQRLFSSRFT